MCGAVTRDVLVTRRPENASVLQSSQSVVDRRRGMRALVICVNDHRHVMTLPPFLSSGYSHSGCRPGGGDR